ncbi:hypothetical protein [Plantactinospora sp. GCM10030261]|uniref:hypothetical protein n=1 Tax=Plantactinospora sp. GCM10030261 TaxID=3273420 RepID=UPI003614743A
MGSFIRIDGDPNEIRGTGAKLRALAEAFSGDVQGIAGQIRTADSAKPWGSDKFGQEFDAQYNKVDNGQVISEAVKDRMTDAGELGLTAGNRVVRAMDGYQLADHDGERDINSVQI